MPLSSAMEGRGCPGTSRGCCSPFKHHSVKFCPGGAQSCTSFHLLSGSRVHRVPLLASVYPHVKGSEAVTASSEKPFGN